MMRGVGTLPFLPTGADHTRLARWAVGLAEAAVAVVAAGAVLLGIGWLVGGSDAVEDTWIGATTAAALYAGLLTSLAGFGLAVFATAKHEAWRLLWLPLAVLPAFVVLLLIGEAFWWE